MTGATLTIGGRSGQSPHIIAIAAKCTEPRHRTDSTLCRCAYSFLPSIELLTLRLNRVTTHLNSDAARLREVARGSSSRFRCVSHALHCCFRKCNSHTKTDTVLTDAESGKLWGITAQAVVEDDESVEGARLHDTQRVAHSSGHCA